MDGPSPGPHPAELAPVPPGWSAVEAAVVVAPAVVAGYLTSASGFVWDDLVNLREAQGQALTPGYLVEPVFGHFSPGHRLVDWSLQAFFPFNFRAAQVILLIGFAVSLWLLLRLLGELFGRGPGPVVLTLLYGASVVHVAVIQWWASGVDLVPATLLSFLCMLAYVRFHRTGSTLQLVISVAALALAVMFYVKPIFVPLYLVLLRLFVMEPDRTMGDVFADLVQEGRIWLAYVIPVGVFAVIYEGIYPTTLNEPAADTILGYLGILWTRVVVPNLFGLWVPPGDLSTPMWLAAVGTHLALIGLVVGSIARRRSAWRAWAFFALAFLPNAVIVGATRIGLFPAEAVAYALRFNVEASFLFVIALGAAFLPLRPGTVSRRPVVALAGLAMAGLLAVSWWSGFRTSRPETWVGAQSRIWLDGVGGGLDGLRRAGVDYALVDGVVPQYVVPDLMAPHNATSEVIPLLDDGERFDVNGRNLFAIGPDGSVEPVRFDSEAGWEGVADYERGAIRVVGSVPAAGPGGLCVTAGDVPVAIVVVPPQPLDAGAHLRLEYQAVEPLTIAFDARPLPLDPSKPDPGSGQVRTVELPAGGRRAPVFDLGAPRVGTLVIAVAARSELCVHRLELGRLTPVEPRPGVTVITPG